jgi:hypothetical protein
MIDFGVCLSVEFGPFIVICQIISTCYSNGVTAVSMVSLGCNKLLLHMYFRVVIDPSRNVVILSFLKKCLVSCHLINS